MMLNRQLHQKQRVQAVNSISVDKVSCISGLGIDFIAVSMCSYLAGTPLVGCVLRG